MDSTRRDYSCNSINGSTRISRPDMTDLKIQFLSKMGFGIEMLLFSRLLLVNR